MSRQLFVGVQYRKADNTFGGAEYTYLCPFGDVEVGNIVKVPVGAENRPKTAKVTAIKWLTADELGFPIEKAKEVLSIEQEGENAQDKTND